MYRVREDNHFPAAAGKSQHTAAILADYVFARFTFKNWKTEMRGFVHLSSSWSSQ